MALRGLEMAMVMVLATALWAGVSAQTGCMSAIVSLSPCLSYIAGNASTPSSSCCTQLASVVSNQAQCLCTVLNGGASNFGLNLNQTQALALPGACNVKTPPVSQCNAVSPAASPTGTPASPSTPSTPTETTPTTPTTPSETTPATNNPSATPTNIPSGRGASTVPGTKAVPSEASFTAMMPSSLLFSLSFVAIYASSLTMF